LTHPEQPSDKTPTAKQQLSTNKKEANNNLQEFIGQSPDRP
jgi:hypothetical protein